MSDRQLLIVLWQWPEGKADGGSQFWAVHPAEGDARMDEWRRSLGIRPVGAVRATVREGAGLDLIPPLQSTA